MKRTGCFSLIAVSVLLGVAPLTSAETLSKGDREFAMSSLHATRKLFLDSVAGLSEAQWNFKAGPDRWSIAECAEHIALSEDFIWSLVSDKLMKSPAAPEKRLPADQARQKDEKLLEAVVDRSHKFKAPEPIQPKRQFPTPAAAIEHFKQSRDAHIKYIDTTSDDLRAHFAPHPAAGEMDGFDWILLVSAHSERHTRQILEVKEDPNYPKQ